MLVTGMRTKRVLTINSKMTRTMNSSSSAVWLLSVIWMLSIGVTPASSGLSKVCVLHHRQYTSGVCGQQLTNMLDFLCVVYNKRSTSGKRRELINNL